MVTAADFTAVLSKLGAAGGQVLPVAELAFGATKALGALGKNPNAAACWLATMTQESAFFRTTEEYNKTKGSYQPYRGRTFEQLTWQSEYLGFGQWCVKQGYIGTPTLFVNHPELLSDVWWAWLGGVYFWKVSKPGLWDSGCHGNFQNVSVVVNGGHPFPLGWTERLAAYRAWCSRVAKLPVLVATGHRDAATLTRLQQWVGVAMTGVWDRGTVQGIQQWLGRPLASALTKADTEAFQKEIGAIVDGDWGPQTTRTLQAYLNKEA